MTMDERTLTALKGSIAKWEAIVAGTGEDKAGFNCPLCRAFMEADCVGCPVRDNTGIHSCVATPYIDWTEHHIDAHGSYTGHAECDVCKRLAQAELNFLKSLLPESEAA